MAEREFRGLTLVGRTMKPFLPGIESIPSKFFKQIPGAKKWVEKYAPQFKDQEQKFMEYFGNLSRRERRSWKDKLFELFKIFDQYFNKGGQL